jgi:hypothetical protein
MSEKDFVVAPIGDGRWYVKREGAPRPSAYLSSEIAALAFGRELARSWRSAVRIRGADGTVRSTESFGENSRATA